MNTAEIKEKWMDYLAGELEPEEVNDLLLALKDHPELANELRGEENFWLRLDQLPSPQPSESLSERFYEMLDSEEAKQAKAPLLKSLEGWIAGWLANRTALAMMSLILGIFIGYWLQRPANNAQLAMVSEELASVRTMMMLTLIEQPSVHDRLKAVNLSAEISTSDQKVIEALFTTLNSDPNVNVRLAAAEVLKEKANYPMVREGLILSIGQQESPLIVLALADIMIGLNEKRSVDELEKLLERDELDEHVKTRLEETIQILI